ncbi:ABC transporter [Actinomadura craniellae]|uniref:ABC transporter n=1 Tax=Actinomadura craniellae TaxID=2231787 RepID=A0A365H0T7_9ACTN|nr:ATP-binding cassette domain-containing protein [Actinomadura craniellae]RAY12705.1 ABC transporter [Actinomadura craniellae]
MIHTRNLTRSFRVKRKKSVEAVRGLNIDIEQGELVAFLGPNGAGKSTSFRMLTTLLPPTSGTALVAGRDVQADPVAVRGRIGYLGQGNGAGRDYRVTDELLTQGRIYGLSRSEARRRSGELLESLDLGPLANREAGKLSGGQRRRLDIAIALVHRPGLLFLDEPSTGLDPQSRADVWGHIGRLHEEFDTTIFFSTHYLEEADQWAKRVLVIDQGLVIADDTPENLKANLAGDRITITVGTPEDAKNAAEIAERMEAPREVTVDGTKVTLRMSRGDAVLPEFVRALDAAGVKALTAELWRPTLDDVFLALTGRTLRESELEDDQADTSDWQGA